MIRTIMIAWVILECVTYALFLSYVPLWVGLALGLGSTLAGAMTVRLAGRRFVMVTGERLRSGELKPIWNSETFLVLGAVLLLLPGFLSDMAGVLLLVAAGVSPRKKIQSPSPKDIELSKDDWTRLPDEPPR